MHYLLKGIALVQIVILLVVNSAAHEAGHVPLSIRFGTSELDGETNIDQLAEGPNGQIIAAGRRIGYYQQGIWTFLPTLHPKGVRRLLVDDHTLWVSSVNEIGKLTLPLGPNSRYEKLDLPDLNDAGEIWFLARRNSELIATGKDRVWFISLTNNRARSAILANESRLFLHALGDRLYVASNGVSIHEIGDGVLVPIDNPLPNKKHTLWIGSGPDFIFALGVYRREADSYKEIARVKNPVGDTYLYTGAVQWGHLAVVTTFNRGLLFFDLESGKFTPVVHPSTLVSLGVSHALTDRNDRLWLATTRGISVLAPYRFGQVTPTASYPVSAFRGEALIINYDDRAVSIHPDGRLENSPRAFSFLQTKQGAAFGFWRRMQLGTEEFGFAGDSVDIISELPGGGYFVTCGPNSYVVDPAARPPKLLDEPRGKVTGFAAAANHLWAATEGNILYRAPFDSPRSFEKAALLPNSAATTLHRLGQTLIIAGSESVTFSERQIPVAHTAGIRSPRLATTADGTLWLLGEQQGHSRLGPLRQINGTVSWETVEAKGLTLLSDVHHLSASGGTLTITAADRILELNTAELRSTYRLDPPRLEFAFTDPRTDLATTQSTAPSSLAAEDSSLTFSGTLPFDEFGERPAYERRLLPTETAWTATKAGERVSYPSLSPRDYTLEVRATHLGRTGRVTTHTFTVLPPWYETPYAIGGYVTFAALLAYFTYRLRTHQIRRRNLELERLVALRTRELAEASAAKSEFVASMSHEIRNPMNGVIGLVNILREQPSLPRQSNTLRLLQDCAEQLRATVDDILDFSKIEARRVALEHSTFDLLTTLEAAAVTVDPAGTAVVFSDKPPADLQLRGDAGKLRQIFANYLNNALKYGVPPGARVSTILTSSDNGRIRLTLSVTSTGPTIEKDKLDALFESFTRGDDAVERNIRGTGLGLAICKRYAEAMGGEVGAVSTNGETTFYLNVPFEKHGTSALPAASAEAPEPRPSLPARALAIEDEDYNRIVLGSILEKMNYSVDWATTGEEALRLAQENGYDIVLTDYRLPDTNGVELTKKILALCPDPKPAVFAVTAYSTRERRDECMGAGMSGFISKPITLEKLRSTLYSWGDRQLTKISLEASLRPMTPNRRAEEIEAAWSVLKRIALTDPKVAAEHAHRLNNLCRSLHKIDIAEQLELLEGALERGEPTAQVVSAVERLLRA